MSARTVRDLMENAVSSSGGPSERLGKVCMLLLAEMRSCQWAGYYFVDPAAPGELVLGPFSGEPTEHVRIRFGEGICGQAAATLDTLVIDDVTAESNYLSCSPEVRSEIVVPVFSDGVLVGELDLDSHRRAGFGPDERELVEWLGELTGPIVKEYVAELRAAGDE